MLFAVSLPRCALAFSRFFAQASSDVQVILVPVPLP
jgi:hypothetical protein